jgi:prevent-host-death family protein
MIWTDTDSRKVAIAEFYRVAVKRASTGPAGELAGSIRPGPTLGPPIRPWWSAVASNRLSYGAIPDAEVLAIMTSHDHILTMKRKDDPPKERTAGIAELKARLSEYLRAVRRGHAVTVLDRDTPVARLVPYDGEDHRLSSRKPAVRLQDVPLPRPLRRRIDSVAALLEERQQAR